MAYDRTLFLALFVISILHNTAANYFNDSPDPGLAQQKTFTPAELAQHNASQRAASLIQNSPDGVIAAVVPRDLSKDYRCTMHMKNTGIVYRGYSSERIVSTWSGTKQLCPQPDNLLTNFHCENAVLLVNETSWEKSESGTIFYDLSNAREVDLVGHDTYDNQFTDLYLTGKSSITGGRSFNIYIIKYADLNTVIYLNSVSKGEFIDLSNAVQSQKVSISFNGTNNGSIYGALVFDSSAPVRLEWTNDFESQNFNSTRGWWVFGRKNMPDTIQCSNEKLMAVLEAKIQINAQGSGGNEETNDIIVDCMKSILNPFTKYIFTYSDKRYFLAANPEGASSIPGSKRIYSTIELHENDVVITFDFKNYLERVLSMKYSPWTNTLTLELMWNDETVMVLDVKGILRKRIINQFADMNLFNDTQLGNFPGLFMRDESSMYNSIPIVRKQPEFDIDTVIDVTNVLILKDINGTNLDDASQAYQDFQALRNDKWNIEMTMNLLPKKTVFYFGSPVADHVGIFGQLKFIKAQNGMDSFRWVEMSRNHTWIDNEASDGLVDRLQINSDVCKHLIVTKHKTKHRSMPTSEFDVVIKCKKHPSDSSKKLILMNYLKDKSYRHLTIFRDNRNYVIIPKKWIFSGTNHSDHFSLLEIIDFQSSQAVNCSVSKPDSFWILVDGNNLSKFEFRKENYNVLLSIKSMNLSIKLGNFYGRKNRISKKWRNQFFAIASDLSDDSPKILRVMDIHHGIVRGN